MCCQRGRVYCHIISEIFKFVYSRGRVYFLSSITVKGRAYHERGRFFQITKVWTGKGKEKDEIYLMKILFCSQILVCYDMLCCHQCWRGRLLDTIIQSCVVFDVTQMSYKSSIRVYWAPKIKEGRISVYQDPKVKEGRISVYQALKVKEARISFYQAYSVIKGRWGRTQFLSSWNGCQRKLSAYRVH